MRPICSANDRSAASTTAHPGFLEPLLDLAPVRESIIPAGEKDPEIALIRIKSSKCRFDTLQQPCERRCVGQLLDRCAGQLASRPIDHARHGP